MKTMKQRYWETVEFRRVSDHWRARLQKAKFVDIETPEGVVRPQIISTQNAHSRGPEYYRACDHVLQQHKFSRKLDRRIFELHSEGKSIRTIEAQLREERRPLDKSNIQRSIQKTLKRVTNE